jgi:hypothetical protein
VAKDAWSFVETVKEWVGTLREDAATCKAVVDAADVNPAARPFAAAAPNYLVTRLEGGADHEPAIGAVDDAMAIRVALRYGSDHGMDERLDADVMVDAARLANEAEQIGGWLDADLDGRFRTFVERQAELAVRGRAPDHIVKDAVARKRRFGEVPPSAMQISSAWRVPRRTPRDARNARFVEAEGREMNPARDAVVQAALGMNQLVEHPRRRAPAHHDGEPRQLRQSRIPAVVERLQQASAPGRHPG